MGLCFYGFSVVDEERSCSVDANRNPTHIFSSRMCGTKYQPWYIEAPVGQNVIITLFNLPLRHPIIGPREKTMECGKYGVIIDKGGKKNISICTNGFQRETTLYTSIGNTLSIILYSFSESDSNLSNMIILKIQGRQITFFFNLSCVKHERYLLIQNTT